MKNKNEIHISRSASETKKIAAVLAKEIWKAGKSVVVLLKGNLGSGKTTFSQGFARGLNIKKRLLSPTFVIARRYPLKKGFMLWHADFYRLGQKEAEHLNISPGKHPKEIWLVEWPGKTKYQTSVINIDFKIVAEDKRKISIRYSHNA